MKIKDGYMLDEIGGQKIAVSLEQGPDKFNGMIKLNGTGAFLWEALQQEIEEDALALAFAEHYGIELSVAKKDMKGFLELLDKNGILER